MRPDAPLCGAARFEGSDGCALNAGHIERGQPDHLDTCGNRWATVSPTEPPPVDEDAAAEARAYERGLREGRARAISEAVRYLRSIEHHASALLVWQHEVEQQTTKRVEESAKQGAASS